eukprot:s11023_g2.t1
MRKEAIPLPLAFVLWLETELVFERLSRPEAVFAGSVLLCIWCSLRFSDAQHVRLEQFFIDFDSIRSISYRIKSRKFMPFGCISGGLYRLPSHHSWLFHWLSAMEHALELNSSSAASPDYIFFGFDGWRARTPMMRGVTFMPSEPPLVWAQEIGSVASIPALAFFRFSEERNQPTAVTSPLAGESDPLPSAPALVPQPALPEVPQVPPLEGETSSGSGEDVGTPEEITFLCAESSCILHAGIAGFHCIRVRHGRAPVGFVHSQWSSIGGRTKLMLALGLSFQAPGTRISGPPAPEGSIPPKEKEKGEKVEKKVEEDPPSIPKDVDKSDTSISSTDTQKDATPPNAGSSIPVDTASAAAADPSIPTPSTTTLPSVRKPNIDPVADPAFLGHKPEGTACKVSTRQITCCREPCGYCNGLCGYSSEIPFDSHFESKHTIHLCKGCFRSKREAKSAPSYQDDRDEEWDDNSWNQSWGGGWSWHYHQ